MRLITLCMMAAVLGLRPGVASSQLPSAIEEPASEQQAAIDSDRYERLTVPVTIGESSKSWRFLIDTGAQATVVTHRIVDELALPRRGTALLVAMGSSAVVETVELDRIGFANREVHGLIAPLLEARNVGADGILGLDSLQDLRVLIDFRQERMTVADAQTLGGNEGYEIIVRARRKLGQMIITDARIDGVKVALVLDTGSQTSIGNRALLRHLRHRTGDILSATDVHGTEILADLVFAKHMQIGRLTLNDVPIGFSESPTFAALDLADRPALIMGIGNMRVFDRVAIDFAARRVLFDLPEVPDPSRERTMFGSSGS